MTREEAIKAFRGLSGVLLPREYYREAIQMAISALQQPEIIRCKDCKYQDKGENESESWNLCGYRPWLHIPVTDDHYCGWAERKDGEADE